MAPMFGTHIRETVRAMQSLAKKERGDLVEMPKEAAATTKDASAASTGAGSEFVVIKVPSERTDAKVH